MVESLAEILEQTLEDAVEVKDKKSLHRYIVLLTENIFQKQNYEKSTAELRSDIRVLAEAIKEGFASVDKRFEDLYHYLDKRFEDMNKRFTMLFTFMNIGLGIIILITILFKFVQ